MDNTETMEICECGNITYMIKEQFSKDGEKLRSILERVILKQAINDISK